MAADQALSAIHEAAASDRDEQVGVAAPTMIEVTRLTKAFGRKVVLRGIDLRVGEGESLVIFGPNGAGKSTFIRILSGLSRPSHGTVRIGGLDMATHSDGIRRYLGVVSHAPLLYDSLTGEENLRFFARLYGMQAPDGRIASLLEQVGLLSRRGDLVRTYSRGMVQRLAIARALLHDPLVLLLDEPDTGLDPQAAEMLHRLLAQLGQKPSQREQVDGNHRPEPSRGDGAEAQGTQGARTPPGPLGGSQFGRTILTITHSIERGLAMADRVLIMANGRIVFEAAARQLNPVEFRLTYDRYVGEGR